jgi:hypothetical protein
MATYQYRCVEHGVVETARPIGTAPPSFACPTCDRPSRRVFCSPLLASGDRRTVALIDKTVQTAEAPAVVTELPLVQRRRPAPVRRSPALQRLPRP